MGDAMAEIERLREQFIAEFEAGESPDPREYLTQLEGADQRELEALLDAYLAQAPRRRFDAAAFAASPARALVDDLDQSLAGRRRRLARRPPAPPQRGEAPPRRARPAARRSARRHGPRAQGRALLPRDGAGAAPAGRRLRPRARRAREPAPHHPRATPRGRRVPGRGEAPHAPRCSRGPPPDATRSSPRWRPRPPRPPSPRIATRWTSCSSAVERVRPAPPRPTSAACVNPYRVLAFAVESRRPPAHDAARPRPVPPGPRIERRMAHVLAARRGTGPRLRL